MDFERTLFGSRFLYLTGKHDSFALKSMRVDFLR